MSKQLVGWGTLIHLLVALLISSCSQKNSETGGQELDQSFDPFKAQCSESALPNQIHQNRIVNGQKVSLQDQDRFQSVLLIIQKQSSAGLINTLCSASVISRRVLLTAGHCVDQALKIQAIFYNSISCQQGFKRYNHAILADEFILHPRFNEHFIYKARIQSGVQANENESFSADNPDLALIHLTNRVPREYPTQKILKSKLIQGRDLFLFGYGLTDSRKNDDLVLRKSKAKPSQIKILGSNLILNQKNNSGICKGDSGAGSYIKGRQNQYMLVSVNSVILSSSQETNSCNGDSSLVLLEPYREWFRSSLELWNDKFSESSTLIEMSLNAESEFEHNEE